MGLIKPIDISQLVKNISLETYPDGASSIVIEKQNGKKTSTGALTTVSKLEQSLKNYSRFTYGSYTGQGISGVDNPNILNLDFTPRIVIISTNLIVDGETVTCEAILLSDSSKTSYIERKSNSFINDILTVSTNSKSISWYSNSNIPRYQLNNAGTPYQYRVWG